MASFPSFWSKKTATTVGPRLTTSEMLRQASNAIGHNLVRQLTAAGEFQLACYDCELTIRIATEPPSPPGYEDVHLAGAILAMIVWHGRIAGGEYFDGRWFYQYQMPK